jgi:hypothetical protein
MPWENFVRYVLIAAAVLAIGIAINLAIGNPLGAQTFFNPAFYMLLGEYSIFHMIALSVARIFKLIFSNRIRATLYLSLSIIGFLASIYLLNPRKFGGVHLFIICWSSLVVVALDYAWRIKNIQTDA